MDEMIDVTISVTQQHIDAGHKNDCGACPIALAIREACPGASYVGVGTTGGYLEVPGHGHPYYFDVPPEARVFILDTDADMPTEPIAFPIRLPHELASIPGFLADESLLAAPELEPMPL